MVTSALDRDHVVEEGVVLLGGVLGFSVTLLLIRGGSLVMRRSRRREHPVEAEPRKSGPRRQQSGGH